jgi:hypothetical protein
LRASAPVVAQPATRTVSAQKISERSLFMDLPE